MNLTDRLAQMSAWIAEVRTALESDDPAVWAEGAVAADELGIYDDYAAEIATKSADRKEAQQMAAAEARYERRMEREHERNS